MLQGQPCEARQPKASNGLLPPVPEAHGQRKRLGAILMRIDRQHEGSSKMTTFQITLPDELLLKAANAGLLFSEVMGAMLRKRLPRRTCEGGKARWQRVPQEGLTPKIEQDVVEAVRQVPAERCQRGANLMLAAAHQPLPRDTNVVPSRLLWCGAARRLPQWALACEKPRRPKKIATNRLERRLLEIEKLDPKAKRQITQLLDSFIEGEKLKQRAAARSTRGT
jgi:hypothetical protein